MPTLFKDCLLELFSKWLAQTICTNHNPASSTNRPAAMMMAMTRKRRSSRFRMWKINILNAPSFDFPVRPESRLGGGLIIEGPVEAVEERETDRRKKAAAQRHDQPLPD